MGLEYITNLEMNLVFVIGFAAVAVSLVVDILNRF